MGVAVEAFVHAADPSGYRPRIELVRREVGPIGALPSKIAYQLRTYGVDWFKVTRRIKAMNRRLQKELGYDAAEKVGHKWALSDFIVENWGGEREDIEKLVQQSKIY